MRRWPSCCGTIAAMKALIGLLWALGGMVLGGVLFALAASLYAQATHASNREGAVGYFVVALGLIGALLGLAAGLVWYARSAPVGEALRQLGQGLLGLLVLIAVIAAALWAWLQSRELPVTYDGNTQASLMLEFRAQAASVPADPARQWLDVEITTANTRPVALVLQDEVRHEGTQLIIPAVQGPLIRAGNRLVVARLKLSGGERHEVFMPKMPRSPDPHADWSEWISPREVFDVTSGQSGAPALLQMRWRLRLYGE